MLNWPGIEVINRVVEGLNVVRTQVRSRIEFLVWQALQGGITVGKSS